MKQGWKGTLIGLVTALAVMGSAAVGRASTCGDLNNDGNRNINDVVLLFRAALENPDPPNLCGGAGALQCGDINADGAISINDVVILFSSVLGNQTLFPLCVGGGEKLCAPGSPAHTPITISSNVTGNEEWNGPCDYFLDGIIFVQQGVVLTIDAGVVVKGKKHPVNPAPSSLIFLRGSKINAVGTSSNPIIMTSDQPVGSRAPGDWGGLVVNGAGPVNCPGFSCLSEGLSPSVPFGGDPSNPATNNDSSGIFRFARVEFAGRILSTDNELNIITRNGLGRGTTFDHLCANQGLDDTHEWFGGNINEKFLVSAGSADDNFDTQLGTTGSVQYGFAWQYAPNLQNSGQNGFELDNNENGFDLLPRNIPQYCNMTLVGAKGQAGQAANQESFGWLHRRGGGAKMGNVIITNFKSGGIQMRDPATTLVACSGTRGSAHLTGSTIMENSVFWNNGPTGNDHAVNNTSGATSTEPANCMAVLGGADCPCNTVDLYNLWKAQPMNAPTTWPVFEADPMLPFDEVNGYDGSTPDPRPGNAAMANSHFDCKTLNSSFDTTHYIGAFDPSQPNWMTQGTWVSFALN